MKKVLLFCISIFLTSISFSLLQAQTPTDAIMMEKGEICFGAFYTHDSWDEYWEGTLKRDNGNIGTLTRQIYLPMFALGIANRINLLGALPYMKTEASGGQMRGASGFQDFGLWLKATAFEHVASSAVFSGYAVVGGTLPTSNYLADYVPFSLGLGCPDLSLRGILDYQMNMGLYVRGQAGYHIRGNSSIERDYYYTTHGVYSDQVDMPNAMTYGATVGSWLLGNSLQVQATFDGLNTFGGFDIRRQDVGFPSNKMEFTRIGAFAHYYTSFLPGFGIVGQWNQVLTGRNFGQSTAYTLGLTYQFGLWNTNSSPEATN